MQMEITLFDDDRVDATFKGRTLTTHQDGSATAPFDLFLASIGTCTGFYVSRFCRERGIPTRDIRIVQRTVVNREAHLVERIEVDVVFPEGFPEKYKAAALRAANLCTVKKHLETVPEIRVRDATPVQA